MARRIASFLAFFCLAALTGTVRPVDADPRPELSAYMVTSTDGDAHRNSAANEMLSLETAGGHTVVKLTQVDGRTMVANAVVAPNGAVQIQTNDPAIVCYNMAMTLRDTSAAKPMSAIDVAFGGAPVNVPLRSTFFGFPDGTIDISAAGSVTEPGAAASGPALGIFVTGTVRSMQNMLVGAQFLERGITPRSGAVFAQVSCSVARLQAAPATRTDALY